MDQDGFRTINQFIGTQIAPASTGKARGSPSAPSPSSAWAPPSNRPTSPAPPRWSPPAAQTANGGVLALPSNSGSFERSVFGLVPEVGLDLSVNITQNIRLKFGYSFLYWNHVDRPGSQYDTNINPGQVNSSFFYGNTTGPTAPQHRFNDETFWTNSFNLGLEVHF